jgi:hypothetical protein
MRRTVVITKRAGGRLANRMLLFAHLIGAAAEHGFVVSDPAFLRYARYFPATSRDLLCRFPPERAVRPFPGGRHLLYVAGELGGGLLHLLQRRGLDVGLVRLRRDQHLDLNSDAFLDVVRAHRLVLVQDWNFRNGANCARHRDVICSFFTPWEKHLARVRAVVEPIRRRGRFLVGVHIRRGDYRDFKGGRLFYSHAEYRNVMVGIEALFTDQDVTFLACSDEPVPREAFAGLDVVLGPGHELEDLYALASCDRIMGPQSTYTTWASYYGGVPRYWIRDPAQLVARSSFVVDRGLGRPVEPAGEATRA